MKKSILFASFILASLALVGSPTSLTWNCDAGVGLSGNCTPGAVTFSSSNMPSTVHVTVVRSSNGTVYDDWDYAPAGGGVLVFTETLQPADSYTVTVTGSGVSETQTITTGL